jgi:hypothetical protein
MTNGLLIHGEIYAHFLIYLGRPSLYTLQLLRSEFPHIQYEENLIFFFIRVQYAHEARKIPFLTFEVKETKTHNSTFGHGGLSVL